EKKYLEASIDLGRTEARALRHSFEMQARVWKDREFDAEFWKWMIPVWRDAVKLAMWNVAARYRERLALTLARAVNRTTPSAGNELLFSKELEWLTLEF